MAKRFKLKFSRMISFQSCRSKDPSTLPSNPVPSFLRLSPVNHNISIIINNLHLPPSQPPSSKPHYHSSIKRHVSSAFTSMGCGIRSKSSTHYPSETDHIKSSLPTENFHWEKEKKYHVVAKLFDDDSTPRRKIYNSSASEDSSNGDVFLAPTNIEKKKRRVKKKKTASRIRISTSSADSGLFFSGDEDVINDEETETLVSSRSFSTDSSPEFNPHLETIRESPFTRKRRGKKAKGPCVLKNGTKGTTRGRGKARNSCDGSLSPARLSRFQWLIPCTVEGKVRESFAVVKKSEDPYDDFRRSMMEMILEKEMFEEKDLEQLLHCFLSLNSRDHHGVIVQAFSEIWEALFCRKRRSISYRVSAV